METSGDDNLLWTVERSEMPVSVRHSTASLSRPRKESNDLATTPTAIERILVTGITGTQTSDLLREFIEAYQCKARLHELESQERGSLDHYCESCLMHYDLGQIMRDNARVEGIRFDERTILQAPSSTLKALAGRGAQTVFSPLEKPGLHIVDGHATFLPTTGFIEGLSFADVQRIDPDVLVTVIDGPQQVHKALQQHPAQYFDLSIADIVKWQETEVYVTAQWAQILQRPHFVVPRSHGSRILRSLLLDRKPPIYASYPMTELAGPEREEVTRFIESLWESFTVFDPGAIESSHGTETYFSREDRRAIFSHTIVRDLNWFVGINSEIVIAYMVIRANGKGPAVVPSSGSNDELRYAHEVGMETYLVMGRSNVDPLPRISPFTWYKAKMFVTPEELFYYVGLSPEMRSAYDIIVREVMVWIGTAGGSSLTHTQMDDLVEECRRRCQYNLPAEHFGGVEDKLDSLVKRLAFAWRISKSGPRALKPGNRDSSLAG